MNMIVDTADADLMPSQENMSRFHPAQFARLDRGRVPHHIAIIPDGNRRWAKQRLSSPQEGHQEGANTLMDIVEAARDMGIGMITFYGFSTENWSRSKQEVATLMLLIASNLINERPRMVQEGIKLETIGDLTKLSPYLNKVIQETKDATKICGKIQLNLALNYGGRDEICRAIQNMMRDYDQGTLQKEDISQHTISGYLDTGHWADPELLVRTSGELRISNFLLWQISYTEIHVSPVLWPDFTPQHLLDAVLDYQERERRWGGA